VPEFIGGKNGPRAAKRQAAKPVKRLHTAELFGHTADMEGDASNLARRLGVVLLAAGSSRRMERPKLLLPWGGTSIAGHQIALWNDLGAKQIALVCAAGDAAMRAELDRIDFPAENRIVNHAPQQGMFSSIRCAARWAGWTTGLTHWAITLGDQPHLRPETLRALLECAATHPGKVWQPRCHGHFRHPVLMPKTVFLQLGDTPETTLKDFLGKLPENAAGCDVDDPGLEQDIDTPADYEKALALYTSRQNSSS
jgi:molybdenum cofactor cytidylyltransferase